MSNEAKARELALEIAGVLMAQNMLDVPCAVAIYPIQKVIAIALADVERETRVDEANWWYHKYAWPPDGEARALVIEGIDRIAKLEHATPPMCNLRHRDGWYCIRARGHQERGEGECSPDVEKYWRDSRDRLSTP